MNLTQRLILEAVACSEAPVTFKQIRALIRQRTGYPTKIVGFTEHVHPLFQAQYIKRHYPPGTTKKDPLYAYYSLGRRCPKNIRSLGLNDRRPRINDLEAHPCP